MSNGDLHWIANYIWGIADDVLRDLYVRGKYRDVILPMTVLRQLDAVLEDSKRNVLSPNVQDILENFEFRNQIPRLAKADALGTLIEKLTSPDVNLSPAPVKNADGSVRHPGLDNHGMGSIFEELVRRFNEENNEEAGEHWTPRDAVRLMARLVFLPVAEESGLCSERKDTCRPDSRVARSRRSKASYRRPPGGRRADPPGFPPRPASLARLLARVARAAECLPSEGVQCFAR